MPCPWHWPWASLPSSGPPACEPRGGPFLGLPRPPQPRWGPRDPGLAASSGGLGQIPRAPIAGEPPSHLSREGGTRLPGQREGGDRHSDPFRFHIHSVWFPIFFTRNSRGINDEEPVWSCLCCSRGGDPKSQCQSCLNCHCHGFPQRGHGPPQAPPPTSGGGGGGGHSWGRPEKEHRVEELRGPSRRSGPSHTEWSGRTSYPSAPKHPPDLGLQVSREAALGHPRLSCVLEPHRHCPAWPGWVRVPWVIPTSMPSSPLDHLNPRGERGVSVCECECE